MKKIELTKNKFTMVDDNIYPILILKKWCISSTGRAVRTIVGSDFKRKTCLMHRFVWETIHGAIPNGLEIDHVDRNPLNNQINNLRLLDHRGNCQNGGVKTIPLDEKSTAMSISVKNRIQKLMRMQALSENRKISPMLQQAFVEYRDRYRHNSELASEVKP